MGNYRCRCCDTGECDATEIRLFNQTIPVLKKNIDKGIRKIIEILKQTRLKICRTMQDSE
jgi:hypothetical protein